MVLTQISVVKAQQWDLLKSFPMDSNYHGRSALDMDGNIYSVSYFSNAISFDTCTQYSNGMHDIYFAKLNNMGVPIFVKSIGNALENDSYNVAIDKDKNIIILGSFLDTLLIGSTTLVSRGGTDKFIAKYDSSGNFIWAKKCGSIDDDGGGLFERLVLDTLGNIYLGFSFGGNLVPQTSKDTFFYEQMFVVSFGKGDYLLAKISPDGNPIWLKNIGTKSDDFGGRISIDQYGNVYGEFLAGTHKIYFENDSLILPFQTNVNMVVKYDSNGQLIWINHCYISAGFGSLFLADISTDNIGNTYVLGQLNQADQIKFGNVTMDADFYSPIFVVKLDKYGEAKWIKRGVGLGGQIHSGCIVVDSSNKIYVTGTGAHSTTFGTDTIYTANGGNGFHIFIWQCDTNGIEQQLYSVGEASESPTGFSKSPDGSTILINGNASNTTLNFGNLSETYGNNQIYLYLARLSPGYPTQLPTVDRQDNIVVYPNPCNSYATISLPDNNSSKEIIVTDNAGKQMYRLKTKKNQTTIPVMFWKEGVYLILIHQGNKMISKKMIIKHA